MKKILLILALLATQSFGVGSIYTTFYATPIATTNYNTAKILMKGSDGSISGNIGNFSGRVTVNSIYATTYLNVPSTGGVSGITTANADLRYLTPNYNGAVTFNSVYATTYLNYPTSGGGGGITTENADLRYVSLNYTGNVSMNGNVHVDVLAVGMSPFDDAIVVSGSIGIYSGGTERIKLNGATGTINAVAFVGDGKGITGITATAAPAGSNQWLQFNDNGTTSADVGLQWVSSTNTLVVDDTGGSIQFTGLATDPATPPTGSIKLYGKSVGGRMMIKQKSPSGVDTAIQPFLGTNSIYLWTPNTGTTGVGTGFGQVHPACTGTITHPTVVNTNFMTRVKFMQLNNVVTTPMQILGFTGSTATLANLHRGSVAGSGGFYMYARVAYPLVTRGGGGTIGIQTFVGLTSMTTGMVATTDIKLTGDFCGFWQGISDNATTMAFICRDNVTLTRNYFTIPNGGIVSNTLYDYTIYSPPNGSYISYRMVEVSTNTVVTENIAVNNLPRNTIFMGTQVQMSNGTGNITVGTNGIGINKIYWECDN